MCLCGTAALEEKAADLCPLSPLLPETWLQELAAQQPQCGRECECHRLPTVKEELEGDRIDCVPPAGEPPATSSYVMSVYAEICIKLYYSCSVFCYLWLN